MQSREALGVDTKDHVVVIDEAHSQATLAIKWKEANFLVDLIDTILSIHTVSLPGTTLKKSLQQLRTYLQRFRKVIYLSVICSFHI